MRINVTLATNRLQLETFVGSNLYSSVTYINIVAVSRGEDVNRLVTAPTPSGAPTTTTTKDDFIVWLHLADQKIVAIPLAYVANKPGWTNDQAGYEQAEADIYAAFPAGGGGGGLSGIDGTPVGYVFAGSPTAVMGVDDAPTARNAIHAADYYPLWTFSTNTTTNADPGAHIFRMNSATIGSVSEITFSTTASFEGGDQSVEPWMYGWGDVIMLKNIANNDIIITAIGTQLNNSGYLRASCSLTATIIGGVANAQPTNNSVWRVVSVGDYIINANVQAQLNEKQNIIESVVTLNSSDVVVPGNVNTTYYIADAAGSAEVQDAGTVVSGIKVTINVDPSATQIKFIPSGNLDGSGSPLTISSGGHVQLTSIGSGNWITTG